MCWQTMVQRFAIRVSAKIAVLVRHAASLPLSCRICYFKCFVLPEFLYTSNAYVPYLSVHQELRLERLFKRALRSVCKVPPWTPTVTLLERVHVSPLRATILLNLLCFIWRCLNSSGSGLFETFFRPLSSRRSRGGNSNLLIVHAAASAHSTKLVTHAGAVLWNSLHADIQGVTKLAAFKSSALQHILAYFYLLALRPCFCSCAGTALFRLQVKCFATHSCLLLALRLCFCSCAGTALFRRHYLQLAMSPPPPPPPPYTVGALLLGICLFWFLHYK